MSSADQYDHLTRRCPRLGHETAFAYCRAPGAPIPCGAIHDCWWETFDIASYMEHTYDADVIARILAPPPPKTWSLLECIRQARERQNDQPSAASSADSPASDGTVQSNGAPADPV